MPVEILIHTYAHNKALKGAPQVVKDDDDLAISPWGSREGLPNYCVLRITDVTKDQVLHYLNDWRREFTYELLSQNAEGRRYRLSVNPKIVTDIGVGQGFKLEFIDYLSKAHGAVYVPSLSDVFAGYATFDIPNTDWQALRDDVADKLETRVASHRYFFHSDDIDTVIANGGHYTTTAAVVLSRIVDRLA